MDNETKILFNRLIEEVEKLNSPDWWVIVFTAINTIAVVVIAFMQIKIQIQQTKLQKRQTEAQEFELYKRFALIIKEIHFEAKFVMFDVSHYLMNKIMLLPENNIWRQKVKKCIELNKHLEDCETDIELKFSKGFVDINAYKWVLMSMSQFSSMFESLLLGNKVVITNLTIIIIEKPYIDSVNQISQCVDNTYRDEFAYRLLNFLNAKDSINEDETMLKIKNRSKID